MRSGSRRATSLRAGSAGASRAPSGRGRPAPPRAFLFGATPPPEVYTLSLHDALPISRHETGDAGGREVRPRQEHVRDFVSGVRSEEHTSELQSRFDLVCRLLLEKKNGDDAEAARQVCDPVAVGRPAYAPDPRALPERPVDAAAQLHRELFFSVLRPHPKSTLFPYTTLFRSRGTKPGMPVAVKFVPVRSMSETSYPV